VAVGVGTALLEHARGCAEHGQPRSGNLGPEGRSWLARAEAAASGLNQPSRPELWATAVTEFGYGAVYEQAVCRWLYAESMLATGEQDAPAAAATQLALAAATADRLDARPLREAVGQLARRARVDLPGEPARRDVVDLLTDRERAVLELVAQGRTNRQVGSALYISEKTVSVHLSRAMAKLGANRRAEAVAVAYDRGLLSAPVPATPT
jgi:DNA-binding CsgD family transcriptional regulator